MKGIQILSMTSEGITNANNLGRKVRFGDLNHQTGSKIYPIKMRKNTKSASEAPTTIGMLNKHGRKVRQPNPDTLETA
jgi:hypothetical protein